MTEQEAKAVIDVESLRIICDECVRLVQYRRLEIIGADLVTYVAFQCHAGPQVGSLPQFFVRQVQHTQRSVNDTFTILLSQINILTVQDLENWHTNIETEIGKYGAVQAELEKAMKGR